MVFRFDVRSFAFKAMMQECEVAKANVRRQRSESAKM